MKTKGFGSFTRMKLTLLAGGLLALFVVSTAVAAAPGDPFKLGVVNTINALTTLTGSLNGQLLLVNNTNTGSSAQAIKATSRAPAGTIRAENSGGGPALSLKVNAGVAPLAVDANTAKVVNLNADKLDGLDASAFLRSTTYNISSASGSCDPSVCSNVVLCDPGDVLLSGGFFAGLIGNEITASKPTDDNRGWYVDWIDGSADSVTVYAHCADLGTPHGGGSAPQLSPRPSTPSTP